MSRLLPLRPPVDRDDAEPRVLDIADEDAADVFGALGSETARDLLNAVYEEPRPASELADAVGTSLQNARYHLEKLVAADLVEVADTWYSERGTEMKVYAPANGSVAVVAGDDGGVRETLAALLGAVGLLAVGALLVQWVARRSASSAGGVTAANAPEHAADPGLAGLLTEPGVLFFGGGLLVLAALWLHAARRHPT